MRDAIDFALPTARSHWIAEKKRCRQEWHLCRPEGVPADLWPFATLSRTMSTPIGRYSVGANCPSAEQGMHVQRAKKARGIQ